jgi:hypothetical protein
MENNSLGSGVAQKVQSADVMGSRGTPLGVARANKDMR